MVEHARNRRFIAYALNFIMEINVNIVITKLNTTYILNNLGNIYIK